MASKEAERYFENEWAKTRAYEVMKSIPIEDAIEKAFDAGVESVNKRIGEVNDYYKQLEGMSEDYQAGYIQAEKDMPKQFEAVRDIIRLQKEVDTLKLKNKDCEKEFAAKLLEELGEELDKDNYLQVKAVIEYLGISIER